MKKIFGFKITMLSLVVCCICFLALPAHAQLGKLGSKVWDRTKTKADRETQQRTTKAADRTIDKGFDKVEDVFKPKNKRSGADKEEGEFDDMGDDDFMTTGDVSNEPYKSDFVGTFEMEFETYKNGQKQGDTYKAKYYFNKNKVAVEMTDKGKMARIIFDHDANTLALVDPERKTAMVMKQSSVSNNQENSDYEVVRNGDTKFVLGRKCTKYTATSDEGIAEMWIDESVRFDYEDAMRGVTGNKVKQSAKAGYMNEISGFPIEVEYKEKSKDNETVVTRTTMVNVGSASPHAFDLSGLEVQDMSAFQGN